jgi:predicted nucleic-acid-binding protein
VRTLDTNVVLRLVYRDDPKQASLAEACWLDALKSGGIFLPTVVLVELAWVLRAKAKFDRAAIAAALEDLCDTEDVLVERADVIRKALRAYRDGAADFSDCIIAETARLHSALPVMTFDRNFAREQGVEELLEE